MKKLLTVLLVVSMLMGLAILPASAEGIAKDELKIGVIHILEPGDQGYTYNHHMGCLKALENLGLAESQYIPKFNIDETDTAAATAALNELIDAGCQIIFGTSFSYGTTMVEVAKEHPEVVFCHATGSDAHFAGLDNLHNYFARIHEARYLAGIVAGLNTKNNKLGYVAAFPFAEVISGYTAFYLGAKSVNPDVTMDVMYANTWGDPTIESQVAQALCDRGCDVISQHSDSTAPATTAEKNGVLHVGYNNDMIAAAPAASLISARIDWSKYMTYAIGCMLNGETIVMDWSDGLAQEAVYLSPLNTTIAAEGTQEAVDAAAAKIIAGELDIFKGPFTAVGGAPATVVEYGATEPMFTFDTDAVFEESTVEGTQGADGFVSGFSAPLFNAILEGVTEVQ